MVITSTQFQQNVGYYLKQADLGKEVIIEKKRPKGLSYTLKQRKDEKQNKRKKVIEKIRKEIVNSDFKFGNTHDPLEYQDSIRD